MGEIQLSSYYSIYQVSQRCDSSRNMRSTPNAKTYCLSLLLLLTIGQSLSFRGDVQISQSKLLSISSSVLNSANQTSSATDLESLSTSNHQRDDDESESETECGNDALYVSNGSTNHIIEQRMQAEAGIKYEGWTSLNRSHSASYYSFKTQLLNERPLGGFSSLWKRNSAHRSALFSTENQNFNVIQNSDSTTADAEAGVAMEKISSRIMLSYAKAIFRMCRPKNLPGCVMIHVATLRMIQRTLSSDSSLMQLFFSPGVFSTLSATLLITCVSMLMNDYYDSKSGLDFENGSSFGDKPLVSGDIPRFVTRQIITLLSLACIICTFTVPSIISKFGIIGSGVVVYYYTEYIKPITWLKNACCAGLIAASPIVTAMVAFAHLAGDKASVLPPLGRMVLLLFSWSMSREIVMDITDYKGDKKMCQQTVPVKHGKRFASKAALAFAGLFSTVAVCEPLYNLLQSLKLHQGAPKLNAVMCSRLALASIGGLSMLWKMLKVFKCEGDNKETCHKAVDSSLISLVLLLFSFL